MSRLAIEFEDAKVKMEFNGVEVKVAWDRDQGCAFVVDQGVIQGWQRLWSFTFIRAANVVGARQILLKVTVDLFWCAECPRWTAPQIIRWKSSGRRISRIYVSGCTGHEPDKGCSGRSAGCLCNSNESGAHARDSCGCCSRCGFS